MVAGMALWGILPPSGENLCSASSLSHPCCAACPDVGAAQPLGSANVLIHELNNS